MSNRKHFLVHVISSLEVGGAQAVLYDIVKDQQKRGAQQAILYFHDGPFKQRFVKLGISTVRIKGLVCTYDPIFFLRFWVMLQKLKPTCLHSLLWSANLVSRLVAFFLRIPHVSVLHNPIEHNGAVRFKLDTLFSKTYTHIIAVSDDVRSSFTTHFPSCSQKNIHVICNGVDIDHIQTQMVLSPTMRSTFGLNDSHYVIGSVGRFEPVKNYAFLITSFAKLINKHSDVRLMLIGHGSQEQELKRLTNKLGIEKKVMFVEGQAYHYYQMFDCFVQTSLYEGISIALLEAMGIGLPCVVTQTKGGHPVIDSGIDGLCISPIDLSYHISYLRTHKEYGKRLGQCAQEKIKSNFSLKQMVSEYAKIFDNIAQSDYTLR